MVPCTWAAMAEVAVQAGVAIPDSRARTDAATAGVSALLLLAVFAFGMWVVGSRGIDVGTDTSAYANFFERIGPNPIQTRMEPGFVFVSWLMKMGGLGVKGYQAGLFGLLLLIATVAARRYFLYLGAQRGFLTFLSASVMLLFLSPMFVNGSINAVRQGLAALLVFASLMSFQQRRWGLFAIFGALATSFHLSSLLYLACAPALLLSPRMLRWVAAAALLAYASGLSMMAVRALAPPLYTFVMTYAFNPEYRSGVRLDFALFSIFWYVVPHLLAPLVKAEYREELLHGAAVYLVMVLPFFAVGWGSYSNRFLLPAWLSVSLILAALLCFNRVPLFRSPLLIRFGLLASCVVFFFYVKHSVVI